MKREIIWKVHPHFWKGSFTVEAAFILPFLCFLLAILLQVILYLHDTSVFASVAYEAAQKAAELKDTDSGKRESFARDQAVTLLAGKCLACESYRTEAHVTSGKVQVRIAGNIGFFGGISLEAQKEVLYTNPVDFLRNSKKAKSLWEKITDE